MDRWVDLSDVFRREPIVVKGAFDFRLKSIAKAMRANKMISTNIESDCKSGINAMAKAWECYLNLPDPQNSTIMEDIAKYNEFDCKVLWDILTYIRAHHIS